MEEDTGFDWGQLIRSVNEVADVFPGCRLALAAEIAAEALNLPEGHEGKALLLEKSKQLRSVKATEDLRNLEPIAIETRG